MSIEEPPSTLYSRSVTEYFVREQAAEYKSDYVYGTVRAMAGASPDHVTIAANLTWSVVGQLKGKPCRALTADMRVQADWEGLYVYPDLTVVCEEMRFADTDRHVLLNPTVIFEILSPTTEGYDRGLKAVRYRSIPSLKEYILISQDRPLVERYARHTDGLWLLRTVEDIAGSLTIPSIGCTLALADVYERIAFAPTHP